MYTVHEQYSIIIIFKICIVVKFYKMRILGNVHNLTGLPV